MGEILVELIAEQRGGGFRHPMRFAGPFPSGAPAIFIDQVARLGHPAGMIGCVGADDFGALNLERLRADGVDVSGIAVDPSYPTGSAFVRYREESPDDQGGRDFIFNIAHSAAGQLALTDAACALLAGCGHFHVMGSSLFSRPLIEAMKQAVRMVKEQGGTISFDPNLRGAMLDDPEIRAALGFMLAQCDIFLPSGAELRLLADAATDQQAADRLLRRGVACIVLKKGAAGAVYHDKDAVIAMPGYCVTEIDPTGAGDCFGATFVTCRKQGYPVRESLAYANAAGAIAVGMQGPMEGNSGFAMLNEFRAARR
jgi:sugar/nucleoside kinase (ribokinase family)